MTAMFETAPQAVEWIEGLRYKGEKNGLANMRALLARLGNPQDSLRMIHVAGTNGKGSTCAMLERMLRECGYKTGLYTSPYLMRYHERMRVNGRPIGDEPLVRLASRIREEAEALLAEGVKPTTFELGTALALAWFAEEQVDAAVIEVGLGGRLDPTNVILPEVCLIAAIGMDHTKVLGDTLPAIAAEKAGIIKPGVPVAVQAQSDPQVREVFRRVSREQGSFLFDLADHPPRILSERADGYTFAFDGQTAEIQLAGRHQVDNACLALSGMRLLRERGWNLPEQACLSGLRKAIWPGRLEWLSPKLLIDGAHNPHGAAALAAYIRRFLAGRRVVLCTGMMRDKDVASCAKILAPVADAVVCTRVDYPRAISPCELAAFYRQAGVEAFAELDRFKALDRALEEAGDGGVCVACGSLYLVGDLRLAVHADDGAL